MCAEFGPSGRMTVTARLLSMRTWTGAGATLRKRRASRFLSWRCEPFPIGDEANLASDDKDLGSNRRGRLRQGRYDAWRAAMSATTPSARSSDTPRDTRSFVAFDALGGVNLGRNLRSM